MNRLKYPTIFSLVVLGCSSAAAQVQFTGVSKPVYSEVPAASTGLNNIYVLYDTNGVSMNYTAKNAQNGVVWYKYGATGGGYAEEIDGIVKNGAVTTLEQVIPNCGYIIEEGTLRTYLWVANYMDCHLDLEGITLDASQDCGTAIVNVAGSGADINYYTINGVPKKFDREITLEYNTLSWNNEKKQWEETAEKESYDVLKKSISVPAPYCNTTFTLSGDKLLRYWNMAESVTSDVYNAHSVSVETIAEQEARENLNEKKVENESGLGGSAPATVKFSAYCTDAVVHKEWQLAQDSEFKNIILRLNDEDVIQTFDEAGTYYMRFVGTNAAGDCSSESETYTINIGTSSLDCPNVFSPQSTEGVNDEWKVSYKSIVEFQCWIFNRWGVQVCELKDPSQGWNGKYNGKYVKSGVYYYVIKARGADGQEYNLKGDINIINYSNKGNGNGSSGGSATE